MLGEHLYTLRSQKQIDRHERYVARNEDRGSAFYRFLIDLTNANHIKFEAAEETSDYFAEGITPDEWLQGKGNQSSIGRFVVVLFTQHDHHDNTSAIGPEVDYNLVKPPVLTVTNTTALIHKITDRMELCVLFDAENDWQLQNGDLQALGLVN